MDSSSHEPTTIKSNDSSSGSLFEILRSKKCLNYNWDRFHSYDPAYPNNPETAKENKELLIRHQSEFPPKLRHAIATAATADTDPHEFSKEVYLASKAFFLGRTIDRNDPSVLCTNNWNGPDDTIDTLDEIEVAIRFFPEVLRENVLYSLYPIHIMFTFPKAVSFVPLVLKLHHECNIGGDHFMLSLAVCKQLLVPGKTIYLETGASLVGFANALFGKDFDFCDDLDEASLSTLVGSEDWNICTPRDTDALLKWLLGSQGTKEAGFPKNGCAS